MPSDTDTITLVVPFPPGGSTDFTARVLAERLAVVLDRPVEVTTSTGDFGYNAVRTLLAGPDDQVFLVGNINANSVTPVVRRGQVAIDHWRMIQPVTRLAEFPSVICTYAAFPAGTLDEFLATLKQTTGRITYGTDFLGTYVDVDVIRLSKRAGLDRACMTTDGALGILGDLEAGRIDLAMLNVATATANVARLKPLAICGPNRLKNFPDVPTLDQLGFVGIGTSNWQGLLAARSASQECISRMHKATVEAMNDADTKQRFADIDARVALSASPGQFQAEIYAEAAQWEEYVTDIIETPLLAT